MALQVLSAAARHAATPLRSGVQRVGAPCSPVCAEAAAPAGRECIWANSTALRVALLAWGGRCGVARFSLAIRAGGAGGAWRDLPQLGDTAEVLAFIVQRIVCTVSPYYS